MPTAFPAANAASYFGCTASKVSTRPDLRRWDDAGTVLNRPLRGVKVTRSGDGFAYTPFEVAKRIFDAPKMNLYPIPQAEIVKSGGVLDQNPGW